MSDIKESVKKYVETRMRLSELRWKEEMSGAVAKAIYLGFILLVAGSGLLLLNLALALYLGYLLDSFAAGFLVLGGVYLIIGAVLYRFDGKLGIQEKIKVALLEQIINNNKDSNG